MKVKILLVPLFLVISLMLIIWLVYPAFSEWNVKKGELSQKESQLEDIELKLQKTKELMGVLNEKSEEQKEIYDFLPDSQREEDVIDTLNSLASSEGVSILDLSVEKPKVVLENVVSENSNVDEKKPAITSSNLRIFEADFGIVGNYENIRKIIGEINKVKRFNNIREFTIGKNPAQEGETGSLYLNLTTDFNFLEKVKNISSVNNKIFTSDNFNMSVIEDLKKYRTGYMPQITIEESGKSNPFLP